MNLIKQGSKNCLTQLEIILTELENISTHYKNVTIIINFFLTHLKNLWAHTKSFLDKLKEIAENAPKTPAVYCSKVSLSKSIDEKKVEKNIKYECGRIRGEERALKVTMDG